MGALISIVSAHVQARNSSDVAVVEKRADTIVQHTVFISASVESLRAGEMCYSAPLMIEGLAWHLIVNRVFETEELNSSCSLKAGLICCTRDTKHRATIHTTFTMTTSAGLRLEKVSEGWLNDVQLMSWEDFERVTEKTGFVLVEAKFTIDISGLRDGLTAYDHTTPHARYDAVLAVEGKKIFAGKQFLAAHSNYFERLFYGEYADANKKEYVLEGIFYESLLMLLAHARSPTADILTDDSVVLLLAVAAALEFEAIVAQCEQFLLSSSAMPMFEKLRLADRHTLHRMESHLLEEIVYGGAQAARAVAKSDGFETLSDQLKLAVLEGAAQLDSSEDEWEEWESEEESEEYDETSTDESGEEEGDEEEQEGASGDETN